jgi:hypothetical protein
MNRFIQILRLALCCAILLLSTVGYAQERLTCDSVEVETRQIALEPAPEREIRDTLPLVDTTKLDDSVGIVVRFNRGESRYSFDTGLESWYQTALLINSLYKPFGKDYIAPWKLMPTGVSDTVEAEIIRGDNDKIPDILFVLKDGTGVPAKREDTKWTLTLPSVGAGETYEIYAVYKKGGRLHTVGKLNVVSYPGRNLRVTLVPVYESFTGAKELEAGLNEIYAPYGITIEVNVDDTFRTAHDWSWDIDRDNKLSLEGSGFFSNETSEMKALRKDFQTKGRYNRNDYYLFVLQDANAGTEPDQEFVARGDMPRGRQFGYLFMRNIERHELSRLVAHELGHGIFTLLHSFDVNYAGDRNKRQTSNLMDYSNGTELAAFQWNVMANPAPLTWFDTEEDGMAVKTFQRYEGDFNFAGRDEILRYLLVSRK